MSNYPYGLRQDPFVSPATLSAKEASRLIRRRIGAFGGDGGTLFPIATCDEIHRITKGIPDAILELAGKSLHAAAAAGAPIVLVAHVRSAAEPAESPAPVGVSEALAKAEKKPKGPPSAQRQAPEPATPTIPAPTKQRAPVLPQREPEEEVSAIDDSDPDLPPFQPAAIALPTRPSEDLGQDAQEWVSRFIVPQVTGPSIGDAARGAQAYTHYDAEAIEAPAAPRAASARPPTPLPAMLPRPLPRSRRPRRRRRAAGRGLATVGALVGILAIVVYYSMRGSRISPEGRQAVATSQPVGGGTVDAPDAARPAPTAASTPSTPVVTTPDPALRPAAPPTVTPAPSSAVQASRGAGVDLSRHEAPTAKYALEVATFIFEERARIERARLTAAGYRARVLSSWEYGSRVYRVVLGSYARPGSAERAADSLLSSGLVLQARVITLPPR